MRCPATEKPEIIRLVERYHLPANHTLEILGIPRTTCLTLVRPPSGVRRDWTE